jgi:hypothetical protein
VAANGTARPARILIAAVVAPQTHQQAPFSTATFDPEAPGLVWVAAGTEVDRGAGALLLGSATRVGFASLAPGVEIQFPRAVDRGLYLDVIRGQIELNSEILNGGDDARLSLEPRAVRVQGVTQALVALASVPLGFVQEL